MRKTTWISFVENKNGWIRLNVFAFVFRFVRLAPIRQECPDNCHCSNDEVQCSHQNLLQIPKYLPLNTTTLDLSHNNLATLNVSDLVSKNYTQLRQIILNDNKIETIIDTEVGYNKKTTQ